MATWNRDFHVHSRLCHLPNNFEIENLKIDERKFDQTDFEMGASRK